MSTIYLSADFGSAVVINGVAYHRNETNPVNTAPDTSPQAGDVLNVEQQAFVYYTGSGSEPAWMAGTSPWDPCSNAIGIINSDDDLELTVGGTLTLYTAPSDGELRFWRDSGAGETTELYINDVLITSFDSDDYTTFNRSACLGLLSGDVVKLKEVFGSGPGYFSLRFLPDDYP